MKQIVFAIFLGVLGLSNASADTTSVLKDDFTYTTGSNPNGAWSYGWEQTLNSALNLFTSTYGSGWNTGNGSNIWKNVSSSTGYGVGAGEVSLHPGSNGALAVIRWTAPTSGTITASGFFGSGDLGSMSYYISVNGTTTSQWINDAKTENFSFSQVVSAGDKIDFIVGVGSNGWGWGNTPLSLTITQAVPEPETYALMMAGLGLIGAIARRRKPLATAR